MYCVINIRELDILNLITTEISFVRHEANDDGCSDYLQLLTAASVVAASHKYMKKHLSGCSSYWLRVNVNVRKRDAWLSGHLNGVNIEDVFGSLLGSHVYGVTLVQGQMEGSSGAPGAFPASFSVVMIHRPLSSGRMPAPAYLLSRNSGSVWS